MRFNLEEYLEHLGISDKEMAVYKYLLSVDSASPMAVSKDIKMKRSTVYVMLDSLKKRGLIREVEKSKRSVYIVEDPERIRFLLEQFKLETEKHIKDLDTVIPELKATMRRTGEPPLIRFLEGERAVKISMEEMVANPKFRAEMDYGVFSLELIHKLFKSKGLREYIDFRIKDNSHFEIIYTTEEGVIPTKEGQEAVRVDPKAFPISCDISIFEDDVRIHVLGKTIYGILIKNPELAETLTSIFKLALIGAKHQHEKKI